MTSARTRPRSAWTGSWKPRRLSYPPSSSTARRLMAPLPRMVLAGPLPLRPLLWATPTGARTPSLGRAPKGEVAGGARHARGQREQRGEHGVVQVVPAGDADIGRAHERQVRAAAAVDQHAVAHEHALGHLLAAGEVQAGGRGERVHGAHLRVVVVE